jgi:predicted DNA-binding protein
MGKALSIRMSDSMADRLEQLSKEINRSKAYIIKSALQKYFDEYADYQVALDRIRNKEDRIISSEEMRELFDISSSI